MREMTPMIAAEGTVRRIAGGHELRFERLLPHPPATVWAALTEGDGLAGWLATGTIEPRPGGRVHLAFGHADHVVEGAVLAFEPPVLLAYEWGAGAGSVQWRLSPVAGGTRLELTHRFPAADAAALFLAGWHTHLELLALALAGLPAPWPWPRWHELHDRYRAAGAMGETT